MLESILQDIFSLIISLLSDKEIMIFRTTSKIILNRIRNNFFNYRNFAELNLLNFTGYNLRKLSRLELCNNMTLDSWNHIKRINMNCYNINENTMISILVQAKIKNIKLELNDFRINEFQCHITTFIEKHPELDYNPIYQMNDTILYFHNIAIYHHFNYHCPNYTPSYQKLTGIKKIIIGNTWAQDPEYERLNDLPNLKYVYFVTMPFIRVPEFRKGITMVVSQIKANKHKITNCITYSDKAEFQNLLRKLN